MVSAGVWITDRCIGTAQLVRADGLLLGPALIWRISPKGVSFAPRTELRAKLACFSKRKAANPFVELGGMDLAALR